MYNRKDIIDRVAELTFMTHKDVELAMLGLLEVMAECISRDGKIQLIGYCTIESLLLKASTINIAAKNMIVNVPDRYKLRLKPGKRFKEAIKEYNDNQIDNKL